MKYKGLFEWFINIVKIVGPAIILIFTLAILSGLIRWTYKTKSNIKEVSKNPIVLFLWLIISLLAIYFFYKYAMPIFRS